MYCRNCGKKIDYEAEFCNECLANFDDFSDEETITQETEPSEEVTYQDNRKNLTNSEPQRPIQKTVSEPKGSVMDGFGLALTGAILSFFGFIFVLVSMIFAIEDAGVASVIWIIALGLTIPSLIFGIKSIKRFTYAKRKGLKKPIPALAIGIETVVMAGLSLLYAFIAIMAIISLL